MIIAECFEGEQLRRDLLKAWQGLQTREQACFAWQIDQAFAKSGQIARACAAYGDSAYDAFDIADIFKLHDDELQFRGRIEQRGDSLLACFDVFDISEGRAKPLPEQAATHCGCTSGQSR